MKLQEIKDEYARSIGYDDYKNYRMVSPGDPQVDEIAKLYAKAKLEEAAENATTTMITLPDVPYDNHFEVVDKYSITKTPLD